MIKMNHNVKRFRAQKALSGVTFETKEREIFGLPGPSGAGKTTIINLLTNQLDADGGTHEIGASSFETGLMLDDDSLYVRLNCIENLNIGIPRKKSLKALRSVGFKNAAKKSVGKFSKGWRRLLALARAILHEPKVLFLDEPSSSFDPETARGIHRLLLNLREKGATVFLTTQNMKLCTPLLLYCIKALSSSRERLSRFATGNPEAVFI